MFIRARSHYVDAFQFLIFYCFVDVSYFFFDVSKYFVGAQINKSGTWLEVTLAFNFISNTFDLEEVILSWFIMNLFNSAGYIS